MSNIIHPSADRPGSHSAQPTWGFQGGRGEKAGMPSRAHTSQLMRNTCPPQLRMDTSHDFLWIITRPHCVEGWKWFDLIKILPREKHFSSWPCLPDLRKSAAKSELTWRKVITCAFHVTRAAGFKNPVRVLQREPGPRLSLWPRSLEPRVLLRGLSARICCAVTFPRLSVGQWDNAACVFVWGLVFILIYYPSEDLISSRMQGMDDCTVGRAFNGLFFFFLFFLLSCMIGSRRKKLNCSTCIHKDVRMNLIYTVYIYICIYVIPCCCNIHFTACWPQILSGAYTFHMKPCIIADILTENNALGHPRLQQWSTGKPTLTAASPSRQFGNHSVY